MDVDPDVHNPPDTVLPNGVVPPWQTLFVPDMAAGELFTVTDGVTTALLTHPVLDVTVRLYTPPAAVVVGVNIVDGVLLVELKLLGPVQL
jgi:hypothetical protein